MSMEMYNFMCKEKGCANTRVKGVFCKMHSDKYQRNKTWVTVTNTIWKENARKRLEAKTGLICLIILAIALIVVMAIQPLLKNHQNQIITALVQTAIQKDFPNATDVYLRTPDISEGFETFSSVKSDIATVEVSMKDGTEDKHCYYWLNRVDNKEWYITDIRGL